MPEALRRACVAAAGAQDGVLLYGSRARGTARPDSDVDLLLLRDWSPGSWTSGAFNVTSYRPAHLSEMARRGSLFVLHLRLDGLVLADPAGLLAAALDQYRPPSSYEPLLAELAAAGAALDPVEDSTRYGPALLRLGDYLVRTAAYARLVEAGRPQFDPDDVGDELGDPAVAAVLATRGDVRPGHGRVALCRTALEGLLGRRLENRYGSVEALAVALSGERQHAAALLGQVLVGQGLDYCALTPPPL